MMDFTDLVATFIILGYWLVVGAGFVWAWLTWGPLVASALPGSVRSC